MNTKADIIIFALPRWDQPISSPALALAKEFAQHNRVFYVEHPFSWKDVIKERKTPEVQKRKNAIFNKKDIYTNPPDFPPNLTVVTPPVTYPINALSPGPIYDFFSKKNDARIFDTIRSVIQDFDIDDWIFINSFDPFFARDFPEDLNPLVKVYQCMDDHSEVEYSAKHGIRLEQDIVQKFDVTLCTSKELTRINSEFTQHSYFHPNAAEITLFRTALDGKLSRPTELEGIDKKIIGFTGSIEYRTDFELLLKLAKHHTDKQLVFVGPVRAPEMEEMGITSQPNVTMVGPKKITELPQYLKFMDVVIIPYKKNKLTKSIYPLKINEYLGAGRPIIAVHFSEDINTFNDVAYIADTHQEFIELIDKAIHEDSPEKRQKRVKRAEMNTWTARVEQFWDILKTWEQSKSNAN